MTPSDLTAWRTRMGLTKGQAAEALGLSLNSWTNYARGWALVLMRGRPLIKEKVARPIPRHIELACQMLEIRRLFTQERLPSPQNRQA